MNAAVKHIQLLSELAEAPVTIPDCYENDVRELAEKGIDMKWIAYQLMPTMKERICLIQRMCTKGDIYYDAYEGGTAEASSAIDEKLFNKALEGETEAAKLMEERRVAREQRDLRKKLFGI